MNFNILFPLLLLVFPCHSRAVHEPLGIYLGAWLDTSDSAGADRPVKFNDRMGILLSLFQYSQNIPLGKNEFPFPSDQVDDTGTDAAVLLTIYPSPSITSVSNTTTFTSNAISDTHIHALVDQLEKLSIGKRKILLRLGPEMNGNWFVYGQSPIEYISLWKRIYSQVKSSNAIVDFVWSPNLGRGYPYKLPEKPLSTIQISQMDTNKDGIVNSRDDPYLPFYPGDEFVDWIGISIYHFGYNYPWIENVLPIPNTVENILNEFDFYNRFSASKGLPFMISETAAAFHKNVDPGVGELALKRAWWSQYITNSTFIRRFPRLKSICLFEVEKVEEFTLRDFRTSYNASIRDAFLSDLKASNAGYTFANCTDAKYKCNSTVKLLSRKEYDYSIKLQENGVMHYTSWNWIMFFWCVMIMV